MSVSSLARSAECEHLLDFARTQSIDEFWGNCEELSCFVNGCRLGNSQAPGDLPNPEFIVHLTGDSTPELVDGDVQPVDNGGVAIHLSTLLALATAHVRYQYESVAAAIRSSGNPVDSAMDDDQNAKEARAMAYANILARHGDGSEQERDYYHRNCSDMAFLEESHRIRLNYRLRRVIAEEQQAKIDQRSRIAAGKLRVEGDHEPGNDNGTSRLPDRERVCDGPAES